MVRCAQLMVEWLGCFSSSVCTPHDEQQEYMQRNLMKTPQLEHDQMQEDDCTIFGISWHFLGFGEVMQWYSILLLGSIFFFIK